jgi:hypothetical protein
MRKYGLFLFFFFLFLFFNENSYVLNVSSKFYDKSIKRVAILYWGMMRSSSFVADSHEQLLRSPLERAGYSVDVIMHTWKLQRGEPLLVWGKETGLNASGDEYKLLRPDFVEIDDQGVFKKNIIFTDYFYNVSDDWRPELLLNHICALESLRRVTKLAISHGPYDFALFIRPDIQIFSMFDTSWLDLLHSNETRILLPDSQHWEGYTDKAAMTLFRDLEFYGSRLDRLAWYRKNVRYIVSEIYCKWRIEQHFKEVLFIPFKFNVIRPNGERGP